MTIRSRRFSTGTCRGRRTARRWKVVFACIRSCGFSRSFGYSFIVVFAVGALIVPFPEHPVAGFSRGWFFGVLAILAVLGGGLVQVGKWLARGEQEVIRSFLKSTLEADEM